MAGRLENQVRSVRFIGNKKVKLTYDELYYHPSRNPLSVMLMKENNRDWRHVVLPCEDKK